MASYWQMMVRDKKKKHVTLLTLRIYSHKIFGAGYYGPQHDITDRLVVWSARDMMSPTAWSFGQHMT